MKQQIIQSIHSGAPFCLYTQDGLLTLAVGEIQHHDYLAHLPRHGRLDCDNSSRIASISMVPFSQIKEREFEVVDEGEKILCLVPHDITTLTYDELLSFFGCDAAISLDGALTYNFSDEEFAEIVAGVIDGEIKNGAGSNFLISRKVFGKLRDCQLEHVLTIFYRLLSNEFGAYMTFCFFDGQRYFIGASPERHLTIRGSVARMNPICGTLPKTAADMRSALEQFVQDEKEINELFMVVDETLKMMMPLCPEGGEVVGPFLKEMRSLIHTENELHGRTEWDIIDAFRSTMFAPTMVGSPIESASRVIYKHERGHSRGYYSSALLILGDESKGEPSLDSAITIRTVELALDGRFTIQAGASIVRDSIPEKEAAEVRAKSLGLLKAISTKIDEPAVLDRIYDEDVKRMLIARNERLSSFWIDNQATRHYPQPLLGKSVLLINNEDDFVYMAAHLIQRMGAVVSVKNIKKLGGISSLGNADLVLIGPGPGDPTDLSDPKIRTLHRLTQALFEQKNRAFYGICLGHQIICHHIGLPIAKLPVPCQGVQRDVDIFGARRRLGFYNTFSARAGAELAQDIDLSIDENGFVSATRGSFFGSIQAHPESVLSKDGYEVLVAELSRMLC